MTTTTIRDLRRAIQDGYLDYVHRTWHRQVSTTARASAIGQECLVRHYLDLRRPNEAKEPSIETKGIFWTGKMTENDTRMALESASKSGLFELTYAQETLSLVRTIPGTSYEVPVLAGHLDNRVMAPGLVDDDGGAIEEGIPIDVKTLKPEMWERVEPDDVHSLRTVVSWAGHWIDQLQAYMLMTGTPSSLLFVSSKQHRMPHVFVVEADEERQKRLVERALAIFLLTQEPVERVLPMARWLDDECPRCPYLKGICPVVEKDPALSIQEPEVQARVMQLLAERDAVRAKLGPIEFEKKRVDGELKRLLNGVERAQLPDGTVITGREVTVAPNDGYSYWRWVATKPKVRTEAQKKALPPAERGTPSPSDLPAPLLRRGK